MGSAYVNTKTFVSLWSVGSGDIYAIARRVTYIFDLWFKVMP